MLTELYSRFKSQSGPRGMPKDESGSPSLGKEDLEIFHLARDRVRRCVSALPSATPVVGNHAEVRRQPRRQGGPVGTRGQGASNQDERGSLPRVIEGDGRAVL